MSDRSHVFFDVNALIKLAQSLSHHRFDSQGRFSRVRIAMSYGVLRVTTSSRLMGMAKERILRKFPSSKRDILIGELDVAISNNWIELLSPDDLSFIALDDVRYYIYSNLAEDWYDLLKDRDEEDALMLREAALAYARNCIIRNRMGYYVPSYFLLVSDDRDIHDYRNLLNVQAKVVLHNAEAAFGNVKVHRLKFISVANWDSFKQYVKNALSSAPHLIR